MQNSKTVLTVVKIEENFDNPKAPMAKLHVDTGLFMIEVPIWNNKNGDNHGIYPPYCTLPFNYTYQRSYYDKRSGQEKQATEVGYHVHIRPQGEESTLESKNLWENIRGALVAGYLEYKDLYDMYLERHKKRRKSNKNQFSSRGCDNCRYHEMVLEATEGDSGKTENHYRHVCALTEDTLDDDLVKFYKNDQLEDKGLEAKKSKSTKVVKNPMQESNYRIKTYSSERIKDNHLRDEGNGCLWHTFFMNTGGKGDFYAERVNPFLPINEDKEYSLPYGIIIDFAPAFITKEQAEKEHKEAKKEISQSKSNEKSERKGEITFEMVMKREELDDELAYKLARMMGKSQGLEGKELEEYAKAYVALSA